MCYYFHIVEIPKNLSSRQREILEEFAQESNEKNYNQRKKFTDKIKDYFRSKHLSKKELEFLLEDATLENFGTKDGKIVKLDWGGYGKSVSI